MAGVVKPVIIHFGRLPLDRAIRYQYGYFRAMVDVARYFARELEGRSITWDYPAFVHGEKYGWTRKQYMRDVWDEGWKLLRAAGIDPHQQDVLPLALVEGAPHTTPRFGGGNLRPCAGMAIKDGDALAGFAGLPGPSGEAEFSWDQNVAMLVHELLHAMGANAHEDPAGNNIEHEWWAGTKAVILPHNKAKLRGSCWFARYQSAWERGYQEALTGLRWKLAEVKGMRGARLVAELIMWAMVYRQLRGAGGGDGAYSLTQWLIDWITAGGGGSVDGAQFWASLVALED